MSIYTELHSKYGSYDKVAEFRLFNLNHCTKSCESCFYKRSGNSVSKYKDAIKLADELIMYGYQLETCYLLPTDFFDNEDNIKTLDIDDVYQIFEKFRFIGIASTLEGNDNFEKSLDFLYKIKKEIELQINLVFEKIYDIKYVNEVLGNIEKVKLKLGDRVVFNLALNLGREITDQEYERVKELVHLFSDDGIVEVNFTYLYNDNIRPSLKKKKTLESLMSLNKLAKMYNKVESRFNTRTMMRKPAFIFKDDKVAIAPIIPFDEYIFIDDEDFYLKDISFSGFLEAQTKLEKYNTPILDKCLECENLIHCQGKGYFICANKFELPCFLEAV